MGGVLKNSGLIRVMPHEKPAFDSFAPDNSFKDDNFKKADLSGYGNAGGLIRQIAVEKSAEVFRKPAENPAPSEKTTFKMFSSDAESGEPSRPVMRAGPGNAPEPVSVSDEEKATGESDEVLKSRLEILREYEHIRLEMINEGEKAKEEAREWADRLKEKASRETEEIYSNAHKDAEQIKRKAEEDGYRDGYRKGFGEGDEKGYTEGYNKGLRKCKDTLKELVAMLEEIPAQKDIIFKQYERELFDAIFTIASKITIDSLKQKDKNTIQKMLREAAKSFRNSEYVKISLSKLDVDRMGNAEMDSLRAIFKDTQHIEFEIVKDAPEGTLILDNGSEITDAGVTTQLMMIEKLGKGKFRDKTSSEEE